MPLLPTLVRLPLTELPHARQHKRLRERIWVLPVPGSLFPSAPGPSTPSSARTSPASPASPSDAALLPTKLRAKKQHHTLPVAPPSPKPPPPPERIAAGPEVAVEIEFEQLWEASAEERARGERERDVDDSSGAWELAEEDRVAMRRERDRCFVASSPP